MPPQGGFAGESSTPLSINTSCDRRVYRKDSSACVRISFAFILIGNFQSAAFPNFHHIYNSRMF